MTHFFEKRDLWGHRLSLWIVVVMAFAAPVCWWSVRQLRLENEVENWLPENDSELRTLHWAHQQFPIEERILLTWDGSSLNDPRVDKVVEKLVGKPDSHGIKRGGLPYVGSVMAPRQALNVMQDNGIEPREAARRLEGTILGSGPLRIQLTESGRSALKRTKRELQTAMRSRFAVDLVIQDPSPDLSPLISIPAPGHTSEMPGDLEPPAILQVDGLLADGSSVDHDLQMTWKGMRVGSDRTIEIARWLSEYIPERGEGKPLVERSFFAVGSPVALAIGISEAGLADKAETVAALRMACNQAGIPAETIHMAGNVISESELNSEVLKAAWDTSFPLIQIHRRSVLLTSVLVSTLLAYFLVRSIRLTAMMLVVSLFAAFCSTAIIPATGGSMNMILILMPTVLTVLTLSRAIMAASHWQQAETHDANRPLIETVRVSWMPCFLASLIMGIGLISLCTSSLAPFREFGVYAAVGILLSFAGIVYGLPALVQMWPGSAHRELEIDQMGWRRFGQWLTVHPGLQSLVVVAACFGISFGLTRFQTETKVIRYFPEASRIVQDYWFVETNLAGSVPVETVIRFDEQSQKDTNFLDRIELVRRIQEKMRAHPEISGSISLADFQPVSEQPPEDAGFLLKSKHNKKATMIQQRIRDGEIIGARSYYTISEQGRDLQASGDQELNQAADELWRITAQVNLMTENDFSAIVANLNEVTQDVLKLQPGSRHTITGTVPLFVRTHEAVLQTLKSSFGVAVALTLVIFIFMLRHFGAALIALVPTVVPIAVVFGAWSWMHQRIDLGSMMVASIALGVIAEGTLRYVCSLQRLMKTERTRRDAVIDALVDCGPTTLKSGLIVMIGLLALVPAEFRLISQFGWLAASMIGVGMLCEIVFLPQLLAGPLGWLFESKKERSQVKSVALEVPQESNLDSPAATKSRDANGPPAPHIKSLDPNRKKRRPTT